MALPRSLSAVLLDFDYTLADSSEGVIACTNAALGALGLAPAAPERIRKTIGLPLDVGLERLTGRGDPRTAEAFTRHFIAHADRVMADATRLLPGVRGALSALRSRGLELGIVSTKFRYRIEAILARDRLLDAFAVLVGGEDVRRPKPDPEGVLAALERLGVEPRGALYVGDGAVDAETARRAGVAFAAVLSGVTPPAAFEGLGACAMLGSLAELPSRLRPARPQPTGALAARDAEP